jgi:hypothetical protein
MDVLSHELLRGGLRLRNLRPVVDHPGCGNPTCSGSLFAFLKDRRRPVFEGRWGCTAKCLQALVHAAIRRETGDNLNVDEQHRHRIPLGLIMLTRGWITEAQLHLALEAQQRDGFGRIGDWLVAECGLSGDHLTRALGIQWQCPVLTAEGFDPAKMALSAPKILIERTGMIPLRIVGERILYLGFEARLDATACFAMERMAGMRVESGLLDATKFREATQRLIDCSFVEMTFEHISLTEVLAERITQELLKAQPRASQLIRVHQFYWLRMWLETGAMTNSQGGIPTTAQDVLDRVYTIPLAQ